MRGPHAVLLCVTLFGAGCYHAIVETGATAAPAETIEKPWASGFIFGLVPPSPVSTMEKCKSGVAKVETQHSFLNSLVAAITFGIYTPMSIKVTCAASRSTDAGTNATIRVGVDAGTYDEAMSMAVQRSRAEGVPVIVEY